MINRRRLLLGGAALTLSGCKLLDDADQADVEKEHREPHAVQHAADGRK